MSEPSNMEPDEIIGMSAYQHDVTIHKSTYRLQKTRTAHLQSYYEHVWPSRKLFFTFSTRFLSQELTYITRVLAYYEIIGSSVWLCVRYRNFLITMQKIVEKIQLVFSLILSRELFFFVRH